ncbi:ATP-binding cassette sub-family A member 3-like isoform X2 [Teleopsis dalmanni]|nr:ATP-binding cassette sub-family A member 3-like isoform X2 [Teleopsis dalmanni]XP_037933949.1 ATP-binding cassette sub-family A member 3-like isoform X2 [Teleopsis dalmanni]
MGVKNWMQWLSYFTKEFLFMGLTVLFLTIMFKIKWRSGFAVFTNSSGTLLFFFLLTYCTCLICFSFMITAIIRTKTKAAVFVAVLGFVIFVPYLTGNYKEQSLTEKLIWCLLYNSALGYGFRVICAKETSGEGAHWTNIFQPISVEDSLCIGFIILIMLISILLSIFICCYAERVMADPYPTTRNWNFIFSDWLTITEVRKKSVHFGSETYDPVAFQEIPPNKKIGVSIKGLKKVVGDKVVVPALSMNLFQGEITVFLGGKNSGKSAILSMLAGMTQPTSGSAMVFTHDSRQQSGLQRARSSIGFCLKEDCLFDELTVVDHIVFFSRLRALHGSDVETEVSNWLEFMQLSDIANVQAKRLSANMKRKLSITCALCGDSRVVYLDEPSQGLDNESKWNFWKLLQAEKEGRTILVTTISSTEAEVIGDRVAVLSEGEVKCYGSPLFLNKNFGTGYRLICLKKETTNKDEVTLWLREFIPEIRLEYQNKDELVYQLPPADHPNFIPLLKNLPENIDKLQLGDYIIKSNTVRQFFTKGEIDPIERNSVNLNTINSLRKPYVKTLTLIRRRLIAMFMKKAICLRRQLALPVILLGSLMFIILSCLITSISKSRYDQCPITYAIEQYPKLVAILDSSQYNSSSLPRYVIEYEGLLDEHRSNYIVKTIFSKSFPEYMVEMLKDQKFLVNSEYLVAATITHELIIAWFNNHLLHSAPLSLNMVHNAMAYSLLGKDANITVSNKPIPYDINSLLARVGSDMYGGSSLALNFGLAMSFISSVFIIAIIKERVNKFKLLQNIEGVGPLTYWITHFVCDWFIIFVAALVICISAVVIVGRTASIILRLGGLLLLSSAFGFAVLPVKYLEAFFFNKPATGLGYTVFINLILGPCLYLSLKLYPNKMVPEWFYIFPHFLVCLSAERLYTSYLLKKICNLESARQPKLKGNSICYKPISVIGFDYPGIALELLFLFILGLLYFLLLFLIEYGVLIKLYNQIHGLIIRKKNEPNRNELYKDFLAEKRMIQEMTKEEISIQPLVLKGVTKYYKSNIAVNQIYMRVRKSQCFGLYGDHKAGKTTILQMLVGESHITYGNGYVKGLDLRTDRKSIRKIIGYCPQDNPLMDMFTGREILIFFCLLHGYNESRTDFVCKEVEENFFLQDYFDLRIENYTLNEKRKLSIAIALIGSPELIFLDHPTTEVDTDTRRQIWQVLHKVLKHGSTIILACESSNECSAMCTHLILLRNGEGEFIGSLRYLKRKLSKGVIIYMKINRSLGSILSISSSSNESFESITSETEKPKEHAKIIRRLRSSVVRDVKGFLKHKFPNAVLQEEYKDSLIYYIPLKTNTLPKIFTNIEKHRSRLCIEHYRLRQTDLNDFVVNNIRFH